MLNRKPFRPCPENVRFLKSVFNKLEFSEHFCDPIPQPPLDDVLRMVLRCTPDLGQPKRFALYQVTIFTLDASLEEFSRSI